jgi:hypothetical protein
MIRRFIFSVVAASAVAALCLVPVHVRAQQGAAAPIPRDAAGHPDLTGIWGANMGGGANPTDDTGNISVQLTGRASEGAAGQGAINFERDNHLTRRMAPNKPLYKPEYWEVIRRLNDDGSQEDPAYGCVIGGVPRMGAPQRIIQLPKQTIFLYGQNIFREIPTDGRAHSKASELEGTLMGEAIGKWDGDTFMVDSIGFTDFTWLDIPGYLHSENMHVVERFTRTGNTLKYEVTVEDPMLLKPFVLNPRNIALSKADMLGEALPCIERDLSHLVSKENH